LEKRDLFRLDAYFCKVLAHDFPVTNCYPDLEQTVRLYRRRLDELLLAPFAVDPETECGQLATHTIKLADEDYYTTIWSISRAEKIISDSDHCLVYAPIDMLVHTVCRQKIDVGHLPAALANNNPIITAQYLFFDPGCIILDGNHRVFSRHLARQQYILTYLLSPQQHLQAMAGDLFRTLFKIHSNLLAICHYMLGHITASTLSKHLLPL
jgi:hypothetical protein